jgi:hypothetical protein
MKRKFILLFATAVLVLINGNSFAAGKESADSFIKKHSDKGSVFLLYDINVKVNPDWSYVTKAHKKIMVLKEEAQDLGEVPVTYEEGREKIMQLEAFAITPDNKKHPYSKIQDLAVYEGYPMYSNLKVKMISLPQVTVGAVLENNYTIESKGMPIKNAFWREDYINSSSPMKELRFTITMPKGLGIKYKEFGLTHKPRITQDKENITYAWVVKDIDGEREVEEFLPPPTPESFAEVVEFSSIKSWKEISDWYLSLVKKNLKITPEIAGVAKKITKGKVTARDKARAVLEYLQRDFRYVSMSFGDNALEPHPTDEMFKNKYGDCKDLSLLCKAMLSAVGINSYICLFNTEFSISDPQYDLPIPSLFNHVLLLVDEPNGSSFYIDPVLKGYDIEEYPVSYQGGHAFVVNDSGGKFARFPIFDEKRNYTSAQRTITIEADGSALIESESIWDLDFSVVQRKKLNSLSKKETEKFYEDLDAYLAANGKMIKREIVGLDQKYGIMMARNKMKLKDAYPVTDGLMVIDISSFKQVLDFAKKQRNNPIFYPLNSLNEETTVFKIPKGYAVSYLPPDLDMDNGFFSVKRKYVKGADEVKMTEIARYKRVEIPKKEYDKIRDFFDKLPTKTQQRIIIKKQ